jgi:Flp pilus assembly protein TadD
MRKLVLMMAAFLMMAPAFAQNSAVQSARNYLREKDFDNALKYINQATDDASTKDKPKTWYAKGDIYIEMMKDPAYKAQVPQKEAANAFMKVVTLDPEYEKEDVNIKLIAVGYQYYNDGSLKFNASKYAEAEEDLQMALKIHDLEGGKRFAKIKQFDTVAISAKQMLGYASYYQNKYEQSLVMLKEIKDNPITKNVSLYILLADIYSKLGKKDDQLAMLQEGRKAFPNDANLRNEEINFYIATDRTDELTKKLEDAVAQEPNNGELHYTLANIYNNMANPKTGDKPANAKELITKAENSYKKALAGDANNAEYNFNFSVLYYMQAYDVAIAMNKLGESAAEMKQYDAMNKERINLLSTALPYAEKAQSTLEAKGSGMDAREKEIYDKTLKELFEIYAKMDKQDKAQEMKKKMAQ